MRRLLSVVCWFNEGHKVPRPVGVTTGHVKWYADKGVRLNCERCGLPTDVVDVTAWSQLQHFLTHFDGSPTISVTPDCDLCPEYTWIPAVLR